MPVTLRDASRRATPSTQPTLAALTTVKPSSNTKTKCRTTTKQALNTTQPPPAVDFSDPYKRDPDSQRRWEALAASHPPRKDLPAEWTHSRDETEPSGPHLYFGWTFDRPYMLELARRRRLTFPVQSRFRRRFGGCDRFNFGDLTEEDLHDANLRLYLDGAALREVCDYIYENTCVNVAVKSPISTRWRVMLVLWTNYDMEEKRRLSQAVGSKWEKVRDFMDEAMNECSSPGSDRSEPLWWWSMHNDLPPH